MKELRELIRDLREDHNLKQEENANYYDGNTYLVNIMVYNVMCDIQKLNPQGRKELARYLQYLKDIEEYETTCRWSER